MHAQADSLQAGPMGCGAMVADQMSGGGRNLSVPCCGIGQQDSGAG